MKKVCMMMLVFWMLCAGALAEGNWLKSVLGDQTPDMSKNIALLRIEDEISKNAFFYDHDGILETIDALEADEDNQALLIVLDTPGGSLYDADEVYHALMRYKKDTGRPVYAYMAEECCSAGVLIAMAADHISASRMTITGNIGAYLESYSEAGLYEKLGVERMYVSTGKNKVSGYPKLTQEQQEIYQQLVDESFDYFKQAISEARGLKEEDMTGFLDGRLLSSTQARQMGLLDDILYFDEALEQIEKIHPGAELTDVTPEEAFGFSEEAEISPLFKWLQENTEEAPSAARCTHALKGL